MSFELKDGKIILDPVDLIGKMPAESLIDLIQSLSCQDAVVKHVADQIIDGYTDDGYRAARSCGAQAEPTCAIDVAIRRIAENSNEIAHAEIAAMAAEIKLLKLQLHSAYGEIDRLKFPRHYA